MSKPDKNITIADAKLFIVELAEKPINRNALVKKCVEKINFPPEILKNKTAGAPLNVAKCRIGDAIEQLLQSGIIVQNPDKTLQNKPADKVTKQESDASRDITIENAMRELLSSDKYTKKNLMSAIVERVETELGVSPTVVKSDAGRIFSNLLKNKIISVDNGNYYIPTYVVTEKSEAETVTEKSEKPEIREIREKQEKAPQNANRPEKAAKKTVKSAQSVKPEETKTAEKSIEKPETPYQKRRRLFAEISDEGLVAHSVAMLAKWYEHIGYSAVSGENTDNANDGGIDGRIKATDRLGFSENIILQMKNYHTPNKSVPLTEMQKFCGALTADDATKGLFVTSRKFHNEAIKFAKKFKAKYLALIDGELWLHLADECDYNFDE